MCDAEGSNSVICLSDTGIAWPAFLPAETQLVNFLKTAPEVKTDIAPSSKSDIWSLGLLLYRLFTLRHATGRITNIKGAFEWALDVAEDEKYLERRFDEDVN